jgi:hypothetical protein
LLWQSHSRRIVNIEVRTPGMALRLAYVQAANRLIKYVAAPRPIDRDSETNHAYASALISSE